MPPRFFDEWLNGAVLNGYDPVAYFRDGRVRRGEPALEYHWREQRWWFVDGTNREAFMAEPMAFISQYGAYCAYSLAHGELVRGDPEVWRIVDDKLYLNYSVPIHRLWKENMPGFIAQADGRWPTILQH